MVDFQTVFSALPEEKGCAPDRSVESKAFKENLTHLAKLFPLVTEEFGYFQNH